MTRDDAAELIAHWGQMGAADVRAYPITAAAALTRARQRTDLPDGVLEQLADAWALHVHPDCRAAGRHTDRGGFCDRCAMPAHLPTQ